MNNEVNNFNQNNTQQEYSKTKTKKKPYFLIPLIQLFIAIALIILRTVFRIILMEDKLKFLGIISIILLLLMPVSIIVVVILYAKPNSDEINNQNLEYNNFLNGSNSLDDKLMVAYIGNNYQKIMKGDFSWPALILNLYYLLYRKFYIIGIACIVLFNIMNYVLQLFNLTFLGNIILLILYIVLGINFNKYYLTYVKKKVNEIKSNNIDASEVELINICKNKGGTNLLLPIIIAIISFVIGILEIVFLINNMNMHELNYSSNNKLRYKIPNNYVISEYEDTEAFYATSDGKCSIALAAENASYYNTEEYLKGNINTTIKSQSINNNIWYYVSGPYTDIDNGYDKMTYYTLKYDDTFYMILLLENNDKDCQINKFLDSLEITK